MFKPKRAALYLRISTDDGCQTTENQRRELERYIECMDAWELTAVYEDAESGRKGRAERAEFDRMMRDARKRRFDLVVFWALDRFSREGAFQTINYLQLLKSYGVDFHSYEERYLTTMGPFADVVVALMATIAKQESERISARTKAGMERARANGKRIGRPPKWPVALPVVRELSRQHKLDGRPHSLKEMAAIASRRTGKKVSVHAVRMCLEKIQSAEL